MCGCGEWVCTCVVCGKCVCTYRVWLVGVCAVCGWMDSNLCIV